MLWVLVAGLALWVSYGLMKTDYIIVASNGVSFIITTSTLIATARYANHNQKRS
jgi:hypothetical protein